MPATHTLMAAGVLGYGEPHNLGMLGMHGCYAANKAISEADLVLPSAPASRTVWR